MDAKRIAECLCGVLADTYVLQLKSQNYHWNVVGMNFHSLHAMFEEQYAELALAIDGIAEQLRNLGGLAPATMAEYLALTRLSEGDSSLGATQMVGDLLESHEAVLARVHECAHVADEEDDESTEDLMTQRMNAHRKTIWMLRATLGHGEAGLPPAPKPAKDGKPAKAPKAKKKSPKAVG